MCTITRAILSSIILSFGIIWFRIQWKPFGCCSCLFAFNFVSFMWHNAQQTHIRWLPLSLPFNLLFNWTKRHCFSVCFCFGREFLYTPSLYPSRPPTMISRMFLHLNEWKMMNVPINQKNWYIITCNNKRTHKCTHTYEWLLWIRSYFQHEKQ